jgi:division protein CdvB (Snf7/Vps24/ESCRT-III family)
MRIIRANKARLGEGYSKKNNAKLLMCEVGNAKNAKARLYPSLNRVSDRNSGLDSATTRRMTKGTRFLAIAMRDLIAFNKRFNND